MKIYLVGQTLNQDDTYVDLSSIIKAVTSFEAAKSYVLYEIERLKNKVDVSCFSATEEIVDRKWHLEYKCPFEGRLLDVDVNFVIKAVDLDDSLDVPTIKKPYLEKRCEALEKQNDELKEELADIKKRNSAAQCYLTFYDGGIYETFDHLRQSCQKARTILMDKDQGNGLIYQLFLEWQKQQ